MPGCAPAQHRVHGEFMDSNDEQRLQFKLGALLPRLDERQRRLVLGAEALVRGRGGVAAVARASGVARSTIQAGMRELGQAPSTDRIRRPGGGRKRARDAQPGLLEALLESIESDPSLPLSWISKSARQLTRDLQARGFSVSRQLVAELLRKEGFLLQPGGGPGPATAEFRYLGEQVVAHHRAGHPVIGITRAGSWAPSFAAACVAAWWQDVGRALYPEGGKLLVVAARSRFENRESWEHSLLALAEETGLTITHIQYPQGPLRWTRAETHLRVRGSRSLPGAGLASTDVDIQWIAPVEAPPARRVPSGRRLRPKRPHRAMIERHPFHGQQNFTIHPVIPPLSKSNWNHSDACSLWPSVGIQAVPRAQPETPLTRFSDCATPLQTGERPGRSR